jgi:hypothetical protein
MSLRRMSSKSRSKKKRRQRGRAFYALWHSQYGRCFYCEGETWFRVGVLSPGTPKPKHFSPWARATKEHLVRRADGGPNAGNIAMACFFCNTSRNARSVAEHKEDMLNQVRLGLHPVNKQKEVLSLHYRLPVKGDSVWDSTRKPPEMQPNGKVTEVTSDGEYVWVRFHEAWEGPKHAEKQYPLEEFIGCWDDKLKQFLLGT